MTTSPSEQRLQTTRKTSAPPTSYPDWPICNKLCCGIKLGQSAAQHQIAFILGNQCGKDNSLIGRASQESIEKSHVTKISGKKTLKSSYLIFAICLQVCDAASVNAQC